MKKIFGFMAISAITAVISLSSPAVSAEKHFAAATQAQGQCTDESKAAWYKEFTDVRTKDATKAYEAAKKYLGCSQQEDQYTTYLKKWVAAYDKEARKVRLPDLLYNQKKYPEAFALGKEILADEPENVRVLIDLGYGGYVAAATTKNESLNADAVNYAKKAIQLIEAGKVPESWSPVFKSKEHALAYLNYTVAFLSRNKPAEALGYFIKAAQFESELKTDPWTFYFIAAAYEAGPYATLSADYKAKYEGKDETPESKLALENINQVIDRMVDAYARAVALAGSNTKYDTAKKEWMESLTTWFKYRHNQSDAGLNEMVASILTKPLPPEPTPITSLPAAAPTNPQAGNASGSQAGGAAADPATTTPGNPAAATDPKTPAPANSPKPAGATKPSGSTNPARPKPRRNHRSN
jgi:hypothetical protein